MAKAKTSGRRRKTQARPGLVTSIADIDLSHCGGNLTNPVRDLEWIAPHAQELNTSYRRKAAKIYTHGAAADLAPCSRCASGKGPFQKCVIAWDEQGYISNGNCANCYWFHKTSSCSRRYVLPCQALYDKVEEAEEDDDDDAAVANHYEQPCNKKRKADDDEEYKPSKAKKARGFTAVNYHRA
ncbi:hypothetical protein ZTR_10773 [Talaromyces verruculosus]|nr:hypothetical protein ZTR_10773 [Talaromyces verruculosus]